MQMDQKLRKELDEQGAEDFRLSANKRRLS